MTNHFPSVSVLTIARGRERHLGNVIRGLSRQETRPAELVISAMQDGPFENLPPAPFPIRQVLVPGDELPLARARNASADAARGDVLVFLDVDCIPAPELVGDYARALHVGSGLLMGEVMYLPDGANEGDWTCDDFARVAVRHSDRAGPPAREMRRCEDYRCFWSLNFAMHAADWAASGGFDDRFIGYGGEDTDFGRSLADRGTPISWIRGARVYHQFHPHFMPPIHHLDSIVRNAELFASKWGHRTMEHWLHAFRMMGLIEPEAADLRIIRQPDAEDFALCRQDPNMPFASTRRVIRALEDRARAAAGLPPDQSSEKDRHARMTRAQEKLAIVASGVAAG